MWSDRNRTFIVHAVIEYMFCAGKQGRAVTKEVKRVCWSRPSSRWAKLNTDGSSLGNPGRAGGGGLIKDAHGGWVKGFTRNIGVATSVEAELWALRDGLDLCLSLNILAVEIEIDAKVVVDWINNGNISILTFLPLLWIVGRSLVASLRLS